MMKHIGWCLEKIQGAMAYIPREVITGEDKKKANEIMENVQEYADSLAKLIQTHKFKDSLQHLKNSSIEGIKLQAHQIEELDKDLEHMLYMLDLYIKQLKEIIKNHPEQWTKKADQLVLMIEQKFGGEMGELRKEFQIALHAEEELKKLRICEEHLQEFLK